MDRIVYPYRRTAMNFMYLVTGIMGIVSGLPFYCGCPLLCYVTISGLQSSELLSNGIQGLVSWLGMLGLCTASMSILPLSIMILYLGNTPFEAVLTSDAFTFGLRGRMRTIRLSEITSVSVYYTWPWRTYPWFVMVKGINRQQINLPISRWATRKFSENIFDWQTMLGDLLQRLPPTATVSEDVKNFVDTGQLRRGVFF
jgi:hypothetical protein